MKTNYLIIGLFFVLTIVLFSNSVSAENWGLYGGSTVSNYSGTMNQGFFYQYAENESNLTFGTGGNTQVSWNGISPATINNRTDVPPIGTGSFLYWHPNSASSGSLIKFTAPRTTEYFFNTSFYKYTGGNLVDFYIKKNGISGTLLYNINASGGTTTHFASSVNLTSADTLVFYIVTHDTNTGDSSGIQLNISAKEPIIIPQDYITSLTPANYTYSTSTTPTFSFLAGNISSANVTLIINNTVYMTNNTIKNDTIWTTTISSALSQGSEYLWWFNYTNLTNIVKSTEKRSIYITGGGTTVTSCSTLLTNAYYVQKTCQVFP